eukprot:4335202-Ditylum_brightwellii.AAC.1
MEEGRQCGHVTDDLDYDLDSGIINIVTVRIAFVGSKIYDLDVITGDIASAYLPVLLVKSIIWTKGQWWNAAQKVI